VTGAGRTELLSRYGQRAVLNLESLVEYCEVIARISAQAENAQGLAETSVQWAAEMGLIRIGETVNRLPAELLRAYPAQPWRVIVAMRTMAAHQYDDLDPERLWRTLTRDVPALRRYVEDILAGRA